MCRFSAAWAAHTPARMTMSRSSNDIALYIIVLTAYCLWCACVYVCVCVCGGGGGLVCLCVHVCVFACARALNGKTRSHCS